MRVSQVSRGQGGRWLPPGHRFPAARSCELNRQQGHLRCVIEWNQITHSGNQSGGHLGARGAHACTHKALSSGSSPQEGLARQTERTTTHQLHPETSLPSPLTPSLQPLTSWRREGFLKGRPSSPSLSAAGGGRRWEADCPFLLKSPEQQA